MAYEESVPDLGWIATCDRDIAEEARDVLGDVLRELDLLSNPIIIWKHGPTEGGFRLPYNQTEALIGHRERVTAMLVARRVLRTARYFHERRAYANEIEREGFLIKADEATVREAHLLLQDRLRGRPRRATSAPLAPISPPPASPPPRSLLPRKVRDPHPPVPDTPSATTLSTDPITSEIERTLKVERAKLPYAVAGPVLAAAILAALSVLFTPLGELIKARYLGRRIAPSLTQSARPGAPDSITRVQKVVPATSNPRPAKSPSRAVRDTARESPQPPARAEVVDPEPLSTFGNGEGTIGTGLTICNDTGAQVYVAVGYPYLGTWYSAGWWKLEPGTCAMPIKGDLTYRYYYLFGRSSQNAIRWEGGSSFCVDPLNTFTLLRTPGCETRDFQQIDVGNATDFLFTLRDDSDGSREPAGDPRFASALLSHVCRQFLVGNYVPHREPCISMNRVPGNLWIVRYHDGYQVGDVMRACRGTDEAVQYFTGRNGGDCDARDRAGHTLCFPRDAVMLVRAHGLIDGIFIQQP